MLLELSIKNFIIIEQETIHFSEGLNIITGETGSGKSLVIDALTAILGGRFSKDDIRMGASKSTIEALFHIGGSKETAAQLEEFGIEPEEDNTLLVSREVNQGGRSSARINGQLVTLSMLREITQNLVDIVGQNEHQLLFNINKHITYVDSFGGSELWQLKAEVAAKVESIRSIEKRINSLCGNAAERERKLDLYRFQLEEIENAKLKPNEDTELKNRRHVLVNAEKLSKSIAALYQEIYKGSSQSKSVTDILNDAVSVLNELSGIDARLLKFKETLESSLYQVEDLKGEIRQYREEIDFDEGEINDIEERLDLISKIKRKYGNTIEEVLAYWDNTSKELQELIDSEKIVNQLEQELSKFKQEYYDAAAKLSALRTQAAAKLEELVERELHDLNMAGAKFVIQLSKTPDTISSSGYDRIEFLISPNPGEPEKALNRIASGGEMSRVMLAIKNAFTDTEKVPSIVFDEVDAGIGGITAKMVGQKIKQISKVVQTICITHLPQIACYAVNHIYLDKIVEGDKTFTRISILGREERIIELARMLGGDNNRDASLTHARELLELANR